MCSVGLLHQWSIALLLLVSPLTLYGRSIDVPNNRTRRSVSHAQLMHDKGRSLQEFKRRLWLQELLDEVHTADGPTPALQSGSNGHASASAAASTTGGSALRQKPPGASKNHTLRFRLHAEGANLPQETNKALAYKDQPLKVATKRKKKVRLGRRKESDKKRRRVRRSVLPKEPPRIQYAG